MSSLRAMSTLRGSMKRRAPVLSAKRQTPNKMSPEQTQALFNYVHDEYLDQQKGNEIDWRWVGKHIKVDGNICKSRFYELQKGLLDHTQPRNPMWSRKELENVVCAARKAERPALLTSSGKREVDWPKLAAECAPGRVPEECKRIYDTQKHLCRARIGAPSFKVQVSVLLGIGILLLVETFFDDLIKST
ncbi:hypothetical protein GGI20_004981 [Coemansia sp. BCRC 34301]|nr:hypothetical protein GGI20_004981 [Coemansia sp. BCRC 34301]